ncbi:MAG TPA: IS91 family transposase [Terriglobales bacterium]|nr:IS91 family transposase [Terriglobales bacterium]
MSRPPLEVADLIRTAGTAFIERNRQWIRWTHIKVLVAIARCRTAALGGHIDECTRGGHRATISYNSCRNRHCPKCQTGARQRWIQARRRELLPSPYVHVVFTLPPQLAALALQNKKIKKIIYGLLLRASAETLLEVARNPSHLGAEIGFFSVLHTWKQKLPLHPHVHCVVPSGGLSLDHTRWIRSRPRFFLPIQVLRRVFRGKFVVGLKSAFQHGQFHFSGNLALLAQPKIFASWLRPRFRKDWVVYSKPPFGGPEYVLQYLGRYTHRGAISNHRLVSLADGQVTFRWRDSAHPNEHKLMTVSLDEFLRRFLPHLLPKGFVRIRHFGFLTNRRRSTLLPLCFAALGSIPPTQPEASADHPSRDRQLCPYCGAPMVIVERLTAAQIQLRSPPILVTLAA